MTLRETYSRATSSPDDSRIRIETAWLQWLVRVVVVVVHVTMLGKVS
jgi:hypothetical protein